VYIAKSGVQMSILQDNFVHKILRNCLTLRRSLSVDEQCLYEEIREFRLGSCGVWGRVVYYMVTELRRNLLSSLQTLDTQEAVLFKCWLPSIWQTNTTVGNTRINATCCSPHFVALCWEWHWVWWWAEILKLFRLVNLLEVTKIC